MQVLAVIGDLVASKAVPQRQAVQRKLTAVLAKVTGDAHELASPYTLTLGDEFQAVYRRADSVLADAVTIMAALHPVQVRFAVGIGPLATRINPRQALGMDGPAFHRARAAMSALKDDGRLLRIAGEEGDWLLADHVLNLLSHEIDGWGRNRLLILAGLLRGRKVSDVAKDLPVSAVAVYKNIRAAALDELVGICQQITAMSNRALSTP
jgi:hypothetical protein